MGHRLGKNKSTNQKTNIDGPIKSLRGGSSLLRVADRLSFSMPIIVEALIANIL